MRDSDFQQLLASVKEAGRIRRGEQEPSRKVAAIKPGAVAAALDPSQEFRPVRAAKG